MISETNSENTQTSNYSMCYQWVRSKSVRKHHAFAVCLKFVVVFLQVGRFLHAEALSI